MRVKRTITMVYLTIRETPWNWIVSHRYLPCPVNPGTRNMVSQNPWRRTIPLYFIRLFLKMPLTDIDPNLTGKQTEYLQYNLIEKINWMIQLSSSWQELCIARHHKPHCFARVFALFAGLPVAVTESLQSLMVLISLAHCRRCMRWPVLQLTACSLSKFLAFR